MQSLDYRLTILQAETGYGKSSALAELPAIVWYQAWFRTALKMDISGRF